MNDARRGACSHGGVTYLFATAMVVVWGYVMCNGRPASGRTVAAVVLGVFGAIAACDGGTLAYLEYVRGSEGVVMPASSPARDDARSAAVRAPGVAGVAG